MGNSNNRATSESPSNQKPIPKDINPPDPIQNEEDEIIIMSDVKEIIKLFKQENVIIWHDPKKASPENEQYANQLRNVCDLRMFTDWQEAATFISTSQIYCDVITSGTNGEILVQNISNKPNVASISVFCGNLDFHKQWAKKYPKVMLVENQFKNVVTKLRDKVTHWQRHSSSLRVNFPAFAPIFDDMDKSENNSLNFMLRGLINFNNRTQGKADFLRLSRAIYQDKHNLDRFDKEYKDYDLKTILNWYTKESFLYKMTNNCLRIATSDSIQSCRLILKDLETAIKEHYQVKSREYSGLLYRGTYISSEEWTKLEQNTGKDIEMYGFLSTTKNKAVAYNFAKGDADKKAILTIIVPKAPDSEGQGFAEVKEFSDFKGEEEVLFNVRSRFTILEAGTEEIDQKKVRHLVLLYGSRNIGKYLRLKNPTIELTLPAVSEIKCRVCDMKIMTCDEAFFFSSLLKNGEYICAACVTKSQMKDKSPLVCIPKTLDSTPNQEQARNITIEGYLMNYKEDLNIPFYGYKCTTCENTNISHYYRCQGCQDKKKSWCNQCFNTNNDCASQSHLIVLETHPYTFWSEKISEHELNHLNHQDQSFTQAMTFFETHDYEKAKEYYEKFLALNQDKETEHVASAHENLGKVFKSLGQYEKELENVMKALRIKTVLYGEESLEAATSYNKIGLSYKNLGQFDKCVECHLKAVNIRIKICGPNDLTIAIYYNNIGDVYNSISQYEKSMEYHLKALEIRKTLLGENHLDVTSTYNNLGELYRELGQFQNALDCHLKSFEIRKSVLGLKHPKTAISCNNIGLTYEGLGEYDKALKFHYKSLELKRLLYGDVHSAIATSYNNLGNIFSILTQHEKALEYYNKSLEIKKQVYNENHPKVSLSYYQVGSVHFDLKDFNKAMDCYLKSLHINRSVYGEKHYRTALCYHEIGAIHEKLLQFEEAFKYVSNAIEIYNEIYGDKPHHYLAASLDLKGTVLIGMGNYEDALDYHNKALDMKKLIFKEGHIAMGVSYKRLALAYEKLAQYDNALKYYPLAIDVYKTINGETHEDTINLLNSLQALKTTLELDKTKLI